MVTENKTKLGAKILATNKGVLFEYELQAVSRGCTYFFNCQHKFLQLSTISRAYFDFICENMDIRNRIRLNLEFRTKFISFCEEISANKVSCSPKTLERAEKQFFKLHLIIKEEGARLCIVNPKHVFKDSAKQRKKVYYKLAQLANLGKIPAEALLDRPLSSLEPSANLLKELQLAFDGHPEGYTPGVVDDDEL